MTPSFGVFRDLAAREILTYTVAQVLWAFLGAAMAYLLYSLVIGNFNALHRLSRSQHCRAAGVLFAYPRAGSTPLHALVDQIVLTGFLVLGVFAVREEFTAVAPTVNSGALISGPRVATIDESAGYAAREFGSRLFCCSQGGARPYHRHYAIKGVPIMGPLLADWQPAAYISA